MAILQLPDFVQLMPRMGRLLGLDPGTKTLGLALSDLTRTVATPLETVKRTKFTADAVKLFALVDKHEVAGLVMGWPVEMSGNEGARCQSVRSLTINLLALRDMPVLLWDERLSTSAVTRTLLEADASRARRAEVVDKMAAGYILQGALDALAHYVRGDRS